MRYEAIVATEIAISRTIPEDIEPTNAAVG
jgi:hypothetical protein